MRLKADQLEATLKGELAAIYFISGDEPLQSGEAADAIRQAAKNSHYTSREVISIGNDFEWSELAEIANTVSIFSEKKLIDLRMPGKPGIEGAKAFSNYCQRLPEDTILLITAPKLESSSLQTKWFKTIEKAGVVIQVWPLEGQNLIYWLKQRAQNRGLSIDQEGIRLLASRIEGNLLAASQEIEKLYILYGEKKISRQAIETAVADNARFNVFKLTDAVLSGKQNRTIKILNGLKAEGIAAPIVLWALARETRLLITIKTSLGKGQNKEAVYKNNRVWDKQKQLINTALPRLTLNVLQQALLLSSKTDRQIKGQQSGDDWETLLSLCLLLCPTPKKT